jgi:membrane protease YdiL (CAAX protease family)
MLFLLKRRWQTACVSLAVLTAIGVVLRVLLPGAPVLGFSLKAIGMGSAVFVVLLLSDGVIHAALLLRIGRAYQSRQRELAALFRGQRAHAILVGALMAGVGEELVFRGLSTDLWALLALAVVFGMLHQVRPALWPFTVWAIWQGWLLALALHLSGLLAVTMSAHFLHDLAGFLIFRWQNGRAAEGLEVHVPTCAAGEGRAPG